LVGPLEMSWDVPDDFHDPLYRLTGHFYIVIASISVGGDGGMKVATQWLFDGYDSFLINDPDVLLLAPIRDVAG